MPDDRTNNHVKKTSSPCNHIQSLPLRAMADFRPIRSRAGVTTAFNLVFALTFPIAEEEEKETKNTRMPPAFTRHEPTSQTDLCLEIPN